VAAVGFRHDDFALGAGALEAPTKRMYSSTTSSNDTGTGAAAGNRSLWARYTSQRRVASSNRARHGPTLSAFTISQ
jgi:hypothetical protein